MVRFWKMHGLGNDFIVVDCADPEWVVQESSLLGTAAAAGSLVAAAALRELIVRLSHRRRGIGCDQLVLLWPSLKTEEEDSSLSSIAAVSVRIFNGSDGDEVGMCGNALRCVALLVLRGHVRIEAPSKAGEDPRMSPSCVLIHLPYSSRTVRCFEAGMDGVRPASSLPFLVGDSGLMTVDMGVCTAQWGEIPFSAPTDSQSLRAGNEANVDAAGASMVLSNSLRSRLLGDVAALLRAEGFPWVTAEHLDGQVESIVVCGFGNPHCALVLRQHVHVSPPAGQSDSEILLNLSDAADDTAVAAVGRTIENLTSWFPQRTNVEFVLPLSHPDSGVELVAAGRCRARVRVWERGEGLTQACGSGACASAVALHLCGRGVLPPRRTIEAVLDGGTLMLNVQQDEAPSQKGKCAVEFSSEAHELRVLMTGDAALVCCGYVSIM